MSEQKTKAFYEKFMRTVRPVLLEHAPKGRQMHGFTDNYIRVELPNRKDMNNQIVSVRLGGWNAKGDALKGELL